MIARQASLSMQRGATMLMATVFLLIVIALFGLVGLRMAGTDITDTSMQSDSVEALFLAESGLERAMQRLAAGTACGMALAPEAAQSLGRGDFQILSANPVGSLCRVQVLGRVLLNGTMRAQRLIEGDLSVSSSSDIGWGVGQDGTILMWNGSTWTTSGFTNSAPNRDLHAVYCVSDDDCWAVGNNGTFVYWNGSIWDNNGFTETVPGQRLNSVFCNASDDCWAVGNTGMIARWNGTLWDDISGSMDGVPNVTLNSVYCVDANDCWAVGNEYDNDGLIAHWDGSSWEDEGVAGGFTNRTDDRDLNGVHCIDTDECWAVGDNGYIARWNGATNEWVDDTFTNNAQNADLHSIFCIAADDCWAVGEEEDNDGYVLHWDGSSWEDETSGAFSVSTPSDDLNGVYCADSGDCWAVGEDGLAARLSGGNWTGSSVHSDNLFAIHFPDGSGGSTSLQRWREIIQ